MPGGTVRMLIRARGVTRLHAQRVAVSGADDHFAGEVVDEQPRVARDGNSLVRLRRSRGRAVLAGAAPRGDAISVA